jgi:hypothetical protein
MAIAHARDITVDRIRGYIDRTPAETMILAVRTCLPRQTTIFTFPLPGALFCRVPIAAASG